MWARAAWAALVGIIVLVAMFEICALFGNINVAEAKIGEAAFIERITISNSAPYVETKRGSFFDVFQPKSGS